MRTLLMLGAAAFGLALAPAAHAQSKERILNFAAADGEMNAAKAKGRATLPVFFGHVRAPGPDESGFMIKYDLIPEAGVEYIWAEVISHKGDVTVARLSNVPDDKRFKIGQQVTVRDAEIIDWGYMKGPVMQGHYTTRVMLPHLPAGEAAAIRKAFGW
ncbi:MAG: DUF2314 domain-containing protein [Pseudomonadota bacterium]